MTHQWNIHGGVMNSTCVYHKRDMIIIIGFDNKWYRQFIYLFIYFGFTQAAEILPGRGTLYHHA